MSWYKIAKTTTESKDPDIFTHTIYRLPNEKELEDVHKHNLTADRILGGFGYTIIGRGIRSKDNSKQIVEAINMLCKLDPTNEQYQSALKQAEGKLNELV